MSAYARSTFTQDKQFFGQSFTGQDFKLHNFADADLRQTSFETCDLAGAIFCRARLDQAKLPDQDLTEADFTKASLIHANLCGVKAPHTVFREATLTTADLSHAILNHADLSSATAQRAHFEETNLDYATLVNANFTGADLRRAQLLRADLTGADLSYADLTGANLEGAILVGAKFQHTNLKLTQLDGAIWDRTTVGSTDLRDAKFAGRIWVLMRGLQNSQALRSRLMPSFVRMSVFAAFVPLSLTVIFWGMVVTLAWIQIPGTRGLLIGGIITLLVGLLTITFVPDILFKGYCWFNNLWSRKHPGENTPDSSPKP